jgi:predicted dehydrogenase
VTAAPIRFAILSFAHYHANFWAGAVRNHPGARLVGIWDDDVERGRDAATRHDSRFEPDLDRILQACDAVGITSETASHAWLVEAATAAGKHVLCEKPIATTLADAGRIRHAVATSGVVFMQNLPKRHDPINAELRDLLLGGALGEIGLVRVRHGHHHGLDPDFTRQWYTDPTQSGGGTLIDEGIHVTDFLRWLFGTAETAHATVSSAQLGLPVEDTAAAVFTFPNGMIAEVATSWAFVAADHSIELYGTAGTALLRGVDLASKPVSTPPYLRYIARDGAEGVWSRSTVVPSFVSGGFHEAGPRAFVDGLLAGHVDEAGVDDGIASLAMVLAAYDAARTGTRQAIRQEKETR